MPAYNPYSFGLKPSITPKKHSSIYDGSLLIRMLCDAILAPEIRAPPLSSFEVEYPGFPLEASDTC
jgi:hypothetical protein